MVFGLKGGGPEQRPHTPCLPTSPTSGREHVQGEREGSEGRRQSGQVSICSEASGPHLRVCGPKEGGHQLRVCC